MNKTKEYELTVVVPVYNEVESLPRVERAMREWLPTSPVKACVLMVNDGSKDGSLELMREICARNEAMFYISLAKNGGFVRLGSAYILNLRNIKNLSSSEVLLYNNTTIPIPRGKYAELKKAFWDYQCEG